MKGGFLGLEKIGEAISGAYNKAKETVVGPVNNTLASTDLPPLATNEGAQQAFGTAPESSGTTVTGGRRYRKTRKSKKSSKKTMRRKH